MFQDNRVGFITSGYFIIRGLPFNHYPCGRVEIVRNAAEIFLHPEANCPETMSQIMECFGLTEENGIREIKVINDHSYHYQTAEEKKSRCKP